ncbi:large ribosomal subunit protein bL9m [Onthophagus taurus]|uniref:large ribosomal subunit protein bL9m n=1 Tax=Onthophagus taurus TaxID=166361 RepID=UPI000C2081CE|nr:39S ribosomal protein L9, mitochondrial [Onthophagus taurus]
MWKHINKLTQSLNKSRLLTPEVCLNQQLRTTFILKRRNAPYLHKKGAEPKRLKPKHYIYNLVEHLDSQKQPDLEVILTSYVEGLGDVGEKVSVRPQYGYNNLLLPGLAIYATPENTKKYLNTDLKDKRSFSSPTVEGTMTILSRMTLSVIMNKEIPWTLEPWHIRTSFRKCGYVVPEECITMPSKTIKGPNMDIENKSFYITITINNQEKVDVKCRIHHWSTGIMERLPHIHDFWKVPSEPIFPEDAEKINSVNKELEEKK